MGEHANSTERTQVGFKTRIFFLQDDNVNGYTTMLPTAVENDGPVT